MLGSSGPGAFRRVYKGARTPKVLASCASRLRRGACNARKQHPRVTTSRVGGVRGRPSRWFSRSDPRVSRARKRWKAPRFSGRCRPSRDGVGTRVLAGPFLLRRKLQVAVGVSSPIAERTGDNGCSRGAKEGNAVRLRHAQAAHAGASSRCGRAESTGNGGASFTRSLGPCPPCRFTAAGMVVSTPSISRANANEAKRRRGGHHELGMARTS